MSDDDKTQEDKKGERIAKVMARAGLCSRREAERWIEMGRVTVNGRPLDSPACVITAADTVQVDGKALPKAEEPRLWRYHKPVGLVTTHRDPEGRSTVFDNLPKDLPRVISVGRLDLNSEGLLLLTNSGELARELELPAKGWERTYRVRAHGRPDPAALKRLEDGVKVDGVHYGPIIATIDREQGSNCWITVTITEGKNREVRRVLEHMGLVVNRLIRVSYGPFELGTMKTSKVEEVHPKKLRAVVGGQVEDIPAPPPKEGKGWAKPKPKKTFKPRIRATTKTGDKAGSKPGARPGGKAGAPRGKPKGDSKPPMKQQNKSGMKSGTKRPARPKGPR